MARESMAGASGRRRSTDRQALYFEGKNVLAKSRQAITSSPQAIDNEETLSLTSRSRD
jgi:hypothetical protein